MDWKALLDERGSAMVLYARHWTGCHADAEDIVQDAIAKLHRTNKVKDMRSPALLYSAIRSCALDRIKASKRRRAREELASDQLYDKEPVFDLANELGPIIQGALDALPSEQREVLVMKIWGNLTFREIGEVLGLSINTVASRYRYGLNALRPLLEPLENYAQ